MFQFPHGFLEVVQFQVREQRAHHVLVVVLVGQERSSLYAEVKVLFILLLIDCTFYIKYKNTYKRKNCHTLNKTAICVLIICRLYGHYFTWQLLLFTSCRLL
jgi:hypothetical protein